MAEFRARVGLALIVAALCVAAPAGGETIALTFEEYISWAPLPGESCPPYIGCYASNPWDIETNRLGLLVTGAGLHEQYGEWGSWYNGYPSNGTGVLYATQGFVSIGVGLGAPFEEFLLSRVDLAAPPTGGGGGASEVRVQGYLRGEQVGSLALGTGHLDYATVVSALGPVDVLTFEGWSPYGDNNNFVLDNVEVHVTPEPMSALLLASGLGILTLAEVRRRARRGGGWNRMTRPPLR